MKNKLISVLASLFIVTSAHADVTAAQLMGAGIPAEAASIIAGIGTGGTVASNNGWLKFRNAADSADIEWAKVDGSDDLFINADSGDVIKISVARTPIAQIDGSVGMAMVNGNMGIQMAAGAVVTPVTTPTAPADGITSRVSIVATAAPTAIYIKLPSTPVPSGDYIIANRSANPLVVIPGGASTLTNGATFSCAAGKLCVCQFVGAAEAACN